MGGLAAIRRAVNLLQKAVKSAQMECFFELKMQEFGVSDY